MTHVLECLECSKPMLRKSHEKQKFCSLSCSTGHRSKILGAIRHEREKVSYQANPTKCRKCGNAILWEDNLRHKVKTFCSRSCSVSLNNSLVPKRIRIPKVAKLTNQEKAFQKFQIGEVVTRCTIRKILIRLHGHSCMKCTGTEWNGLPIPLEVDHIDGNAGNNMPVNLRLLCPNCHAQTPTHKGKNKGSGRRSRGLPMH